MWDKTHCNLLPSIFKVDTGISWKLASVGIFSKFMEVCVFLQLPKSFAINLAISTYMVQNWLVAEL